MRNLGRWLIWICIVFTAACGNPNDGPSELFGSADQRYDVFMKNEGVTIYGNEATIQTLQERVKRIGGIRDARVVIYDNSLMIGVKADRSRKVVKNQIYQHLKDESRFNIVFISVNDAEVYDRMDRIQQRIMNGEWNEDTLGAVNVLLNDLNTTMEPAKLE